MEIMKNIAFDYIDSHKQEMLNLWERIVNINSGPDNKNGVDKVNATIIEALSDVPLNHACIEYEQVGNFNVLKYTVENPKGTLLLLGHSDTVFSSNNERNSKFLIDDGKAYGPGVLDMKGGLVIGTYVIKALHHSNYSDYNIHFCIAGDEETAHMKSDCDVKIIEASKGAIAAFNLETGFPDNRLVVARKGGLVCQIEIKGVAAHTGNNPEKGVNAIWEMAKKIDAIQALTNKEKGILYNVGKVSGGMGPNTFPDSATIMVGVRYNKVEHENEILESLESIVNKTYVSGTSSTFKLLGQIQPMEKTEESMKLFEIIKDSAIEIGMQKPEPIMIGGASDSAYTVIAGVPTVCSMGVQGEFNHSEEEYAIVDSMFDRSKLLITSILKL